MSALPLKADIRRVGAKNHLMTRWTASIRQQFGYKYLLDFVQRLLQVGDKVLDILNADG